MNATATLSSHVLSRPKIHRLPSSLTRPRRGERIRNFKSKTLTLLWGLVLMIFALALLNSNNPSSLPRTTTASPDADSPGKRGKPSLAPAAIRGSSLHLPSIPLSAASGQIIVFKDESNVIIGDMAKIPYGDSSITEIRDTSHIDKSAGRELLSIISKY